MPKIRLTKSVVPNLEYPGKQTRYFDTKVTGFGVMVNQNSSSYIVQGKAKSRRGAPRQFIITIGRTDMVRFDDALQRAKEILEDAANGITPDDRIKEKEDLAEIARRLKIAEEKKDITLSSAFSDYKSSRTTLKESSKESYRCCLEACFPDWLDKPLRSIDKKMVMKRHAEIGRKHPAQADKAMRVIRAIFNYAMTVYDDVILKNPVKVLSAAHSWYKVGRRRNYIHTTDLPAWFDAVDRLPDPYSRTALLLLLFTGARKSEALSLKWADVRLDAAEIYIRDTKSGQPLEIPISAYVADMLAQHKEISCDGNEYVFASYGQSGHREDLRGAIRSMITSGLAPFTLHDLRRSFQTYCESLAVPVFTIKRLVGHALPSDVTQGYIQFSMPMLRKRVEAVTAYILRHAGRLNTNKVPGHPGSDTAPPIPPNSRHATTGRSQSCRRPSDYTGDNRRNRRCE